MPHSPFFSFLLALPSSLIYIYTSQNVYVYIHRQVCLFVYPCINSLACRCISIFKINIKALLKYENVVEQGNKEKGIYHTPPPSLLKY